MRAINAIFQVNVDLLALGIRYLWNEPTLVVTVNIASNGKASFYIN